MNIDYGIGGVWCGGNGGQWPPPEGRVASLTAGLRLRKVVIDD